MESKFEKYTYSPMNTDLSPYKKDKSSNVTRIKNFRFNTNIENSTISLTNEKGLSYKLEIPTVNINIIDKIITYADKVLPFESLEIIEQYSEKDMIENHTIIGWTEIRNGFILITTDNTGGDCIWELSENFDLTLKYIRDLKLNTSNPVQVISNFENESIEKIYFIDGRDQIKYLNIRQSLINQDDQNLIDVPSTLLNPSGNFKFHQPELIGRGSGGTHTAGMIQYAYVLYRLNGTNTKLSPLSELIPLDNGIKGGGGVNETITSYPIIKIKELDSNYTNLKLYAIKYTSLNEIPEVRLIVDQNIQGNNEFVYYDTGTYIQTLSLSEFTFLNNSTIYIPKHIQSKDNRLFLANYKEKEFDIKTLDCRTFSFEKNKLTTKIYENLILENNQIVGVNELIIDNTYNVPEKHNCLNKNFETFAYQIDSDVLGGSGKFLNWRLIRSRPLFGTNALTLEQTEGRFLKDRELYRLGIQFYNRKAQISQPKWITDFIVNIQENKTNLNRYFANIEIEFNNDFFIWLNDSSNFINEYGVYDEDLKPVGFKLLRAERRESDKSIVAQGITNGCITLKNTNLQRNNESYIDPYETDPLYNKESLNVDPKMPSFMRPYDSSIAPLKAMWSYARLDDTSNYIPPLSTDHNIPLIEPGRGNYKREMYNSVSSTDRRSRSYQFNQLVTFYSPEITFNHVQNLENTQFAARGISKNNKNNFWGLVEKLEEDRVDAEAKFIDILTPWTILLDENTNVIKLSGDYRTFGVWGLIGPQGLEFPNYYYFAKIKYQYYREYNNNIVYSPLYNNNNLPVFKIYGSPQIVESGAGKTIYNRDNDLVFYNSWINLNTDSGSNSDDSPGWRIKNCNTYGAKCAIFAFGDDGVATKDRLKLENIYNNIANVVIPVTPYGKMEMISPNNEGKSAIVGELQIDRNLIYLGLLYGGNTFEARKRTNYIEIGSFKYFSELPSNNKYRCIHAGDTYINTFKFTKFYKANLSQNDKEIAQYTEIVNVRLETTIDLKRRNDYSLDDWDSVFQPTYEEYQKYNLVYSQENNFFIRRAYEYNYKEISNFEVGVIASKNKIPGEIIDSWIQILPNEVIYLEGTYGPINGLIKFKDNMFTVQDRGVALLSINPRVQIQANDGIGLELGTGGILHDFNYLSTTTGSKHKWSIVVSPNTFYYYDSLNNGIYRLSENLEEINKTKGVNSFFKQNINPSLYEDNPIMYNGISSGYDHIYNDVHFSFLNDDVNKCYSLVFNEALQGFLEYDYITSMFITKGGISLNIKDNNKIYQMFEGEYNNFYGEYKRSYVEMLLNPTPDIDTIFNNIQFTSDVFDINNNEIPNESINKIRVSNEYQNSGEIPLINSRNGNLKRFFREWKLIIPRNNNSRERLRGTWMFLDLIFENTTNKRIRLNDIILYYNN